MEIRVTLPHHAYTLTIKKGWLAQIGDWVSRLWEPQCIMVITDDTVDSLYGEQVIDSLRRAGFDADIVSVPAGETSKSLAMAERLYDALAQKGMTRKDGVIALGGGVVGDLAAFVASTFMRGIHFLQVPTTLLAQVDSSIGGKTAVNTRKAKNLVGTFAQPDGVLIDPDTLNTLPPRRIREGIAEIVKSAAIADADLWQRLAELESEQDLLAHAEEVIAACCEVKRHVVEQDELDTGLRLILNFGHTIGHAIENTLGYGVVTHGEAVAIGMVQISRAAEKKGQMPAGITASLSDMLTKFQLPVTHNDWPERALYEAIRHDKKAAGSDIRIVLLEDIGQAKIETLPIEQMTDYLIRD
ncbi:3-dehydroquinate synthase [Vagococcus acidifermentans]|uniref:3-dehydroquinate synthase n=1 Tax=Vagococcus acidifermentans TaxID=564710 RepID=A0A430AMG3_9ENTE|nr:3-dehydroquinate synthase [Vagococcus acidifermentans]RSU09311.1 3-dehydroquinate synthase [Vagococcus acidifermentans]